MRAREMNKKASRLNQNFRTPFQTSAFTRVKYLGLYLPAAILNVDKKKRKLFYRDTGFRDI